MAGLPVPAMPLTWAAAADVPVTPHGGDADLEPSRPLSPTFGPRTGSLEDDVEVHTENTGGGIVLDTKIDMLLDTCLLYTSPSPRDRTRSRMPSSA